MDYFVIQTPTEQPKLRNNSALNNTRGDHNKKKKKKKKMSKDEICVANFIPP